MKRAVPDKLVRIEIASACNFRCKFCCWENPSPRHIYSRLSTDAIRRFCEASVRTGCYNINLTGGEPLLLPPDYLCEAIRKISTVEGLRQLWITTNGAGLTNKQLCLQLKDAGLKDIAVSIPAETDGKYRRYSNTHFGVTAILEGIRNATHAGIQVRAHVPLNPVGIHTFDQLSVLIPKLKDAGVSTLFYFGLHKSDKLMDVFDDLYVNPQEITNGFLNHPDWQYRETASGRPYYANPDGSFRVNIPRESVCLITDTCKKQRCGPFCQGIYSVYLVPGEKGWVVRGCHRIFKDKRNEYSLDDALWKEENRHQLTELLQNAWRYAYEQ
jgi:molybdenum cofactor biosynthesis enzyme MoaA